MAKFKVGDKVAFKGNKSYKGVVQKVQPLFGHETIYTIKWNDGKQYDVTEGDLVIANSVRSTNSVVAKALNAVGYNPSEKQNWSIHSVTPHGTWMKKKIYDMTLSEAIAEARKDASKYKYEKVIIYDTVTGKSRHEEKITNSKVAMNGDVDFSRKVKVRAVSATVFGPKDETKVITLGQLRDNFAQSGHSRLFPMVLKDIEAGRIANPNYETPCDVWVQWA